MRQLATLPAARAESLADHLLTLRVETKLEPLPEGQGGRGGSGPEASPPEDGKGRGGERAEGLPPGQVVVWVCDEDRLPEARAELAAFQAQPDAPRYAESRVAAAALRKQRAEEDAGGEEDEDEEDEEAVSEPVPLGRRPVTLALAAACVFVFTQAAPGDPSAKDYKPGPTYTALMIDSKAPGREGLLADVRAGEVWRLFTPALLHFGWMHLVMNLLVLVFAASSIEGRAGPVWLLALVLLLAAVSNVAEYALGRTEWVDRRPVLHPSAAFGGLSGVLFGLIGYLWVRGRVDPAAGLSLPPIVWLGSLLAFGCFWAGVGDQGPVANVAHTAGLLSGMALGLLPSPRGEPEAGPAEEEPAP